VKMEQRRYEFILEAEEPIAHHAENFGNAAVLMRRKVRQPDGTFAQVPCVTGDTMRHGMREAASYALLDAAGLLESPCLTEAALRLLFAGGMVTGRGDAGTIKLDSYREMVDLLPHLSLFGGCASNRVIPGRLAVSDATLVCSEELAYLPTWVVTWLADHHVAIDTCRAYVEEVQRVRMDPTLVPQKRLLLSEGERAQAEGRLLASETTHASGDARGVDESKSSMMPRRFERLVRGSLFHWRASATCYTDLDVDTYELALATFLYRAQVGGKRGVGHGTLRALAGQQGELARPAEGLHSIDVQALATPKGKAFFDHVRARSAQIAEYLKTVDA
jgi:hypothetical protein